ncbi:MAG: hypothetical protein RML37_11260 [Chitinophagales bacterium]|nr:hypothetical protein [Chitinophagales bacterium]
MNERTCLSCGAVLKGRSDKKFCDDQCRNAYNNSLNSDVNNYMRQVNHILRKNRRILEQLNTDQSGKTKVSKARLIQAGFNFDYITNMLHTKSGRTYYFCYEHGYLPIENDWYMLVVRDEDRK